MTLESCAACMFSRSRMRFLDLSVCLLALSSTMQPVGGACIEQGDCPSGWRTAGNRCFKKVTDDGEEKMAAFRGLRVCRDLDPLATLPTIANEDELMGVWYEAGGTGQIWQWDEDIQVWIGEYKPDEGNNDVIWLDGSTATYGITYPWSYNDFAGSNQQCVRMRKTPRAWWDHGCHEEHMVVCQLCQVPPTYSNCPADWTAVGDRCFKKLDAKSTRNQAVIDCAAVHPVATLPSVTNSNERDVLWEVAGGTAGEEENGLRVWLGIWKSDDYEDDQEWEWADGSNSTYGENQGYFDFRDRSSYHCVVMKESATKWEDLKCDDKERTVVCQIKKGQAANEPARLASLVPGFLGFYYIYDSNYDFTVMPDVRGRDPNHQAISAQIDFGDIEAFRQVIPSLPGDHFAVVWLAEIWIQNAGDYTFYTRSDDGSIFFIDGVAIVDNGGVHPERLREGTVFLLEGLHPIRTDFFEKTGSSSVVLTYQGPDTDSVEVPLVAFANATASPPGFEIIPPTGHIPGYAACSTPITVPMSKLEP